MWATATHLRGGPVGDTGVCCALDHGAFQPSESGSRCHSAILRLRFHFLSSGDSTGSSHLRSGFDFLVHLNHQLFRRSPSELGQPVWRISPPSLRRFQWLQEDPSVQAADQPPSEVAADTVFAVGMLVAPSARAQDLHSDCSWDHIVSPGLYEYSTCDCHVDVDRCFYYHIGRHGITFPESLTSPAISTALVLTHPSSHSPDSSS